MKVSENYNGVDSGIRPHLLTTNLSIRRISTLYWGRILRRTACMSGIWRLLLVDNIFWSADIKCFACWRRHRE